MKLSRFCGIRWKSVYAMSVELGKRSGRSPLAIFLDFVDCYRKRGTSWLNYMLFGFHITTDPAIRIAL